MKISKITTGVVLVLLLSGIAGCKKAATPKQPVPTIESGAKVLQSPTLEAGSQFKTQRQSLVKFIQNNLLKKQGIYTNYRRTKYQASHATGHEMLSESSGMWLEYLARSGKKQEFSQFYQQTKKTFDLGDQFSYRYNPQTKRKYTVNATLDDLRIIKALVVFDTINHTEKYQKEASERFAKLSNNCIKNGQLVDFYDQKSKQASTQGSLAYFDLQTLKYFEDQTKRGEREYQKQLRVVQNGYQGDIFPLYAASYNWKTEQYSTADLNTSEALETLVHLAQVGKLKEASRQWLIQQIEHKTLYNAYSINGTVQDNGQSPANYALAAMVFAASGDNVNYKRAMQLVWNNQIQNGKYIGGVGESKSQDFYSYNNLVALQAATCGNY